MKLDSPELEHRTISLLVDTAQLEGPQRAKQAAEQHRIASGLFHLPAHRVVLAAVVDVINQGQTPDLTALAGRLSGEDTVIQAGGAPWVLTFNLGDSGALPGALASYASELAELAQRRRIIQISRRLAELALDPQSKPDTTAGKATAELARMTNPNATIRTLREVVQEDVLDELQKIEAGDRSPVMETGIALLDKIIGGLQETLTIVGALPGVGKSALFATIAQNLAQRGVKVGVFSLEDQASWLAWRMVSQESGITQFVLRNRRLGNEQQARAGEGCERVWNYGENILIDDRSGLTAQEIVAGARDLILNQGVKVIMVDHLGELRYDSKRRDRHDLDVAEGLSELRTIAKQYGVPVWCATHLRREADQRNELKLTDFANSAAIERQARVALGLSREDKTGRLLITVLKQTNGVAGSRLALDFHGPAAMVKKTGGEELKREQQSDS